MHAKVAITISAAALIVVCLTVAQAAPRAPVPQSEPVPATFTLELIQTVGQLAFWGTISTIAVLTYLQARRTVLQPIRTEIFKVQLSEMAKILGFFVGKDELTLRNIHGFPKVFDANACRMYDSYASRNLGHKFDREKRPYNLKACPVSIVSADQLMAADGHLRRDVADPEGEAKMKAMPPWKDYNHSEIHIPRKYSDAEKQLQDFLENPLLPSALTNLLTEYRQLVLGNLFKLQSILSDCAKEMPSKYPTLDELQNSSVDWIHTRYVRDFDYLKPKADEVVAFIRGHFGVDSLLSHP